MEMQYFGGIEGGATHSKLIICNEKGEQVAAVQGLGTNHWLVGIPECAKRIADMIQKGKEEANISLSTKLKSLGLSLSGCEQEATNRALEQEIRKSFPDVAETFVVCSDTAGSIATASNIGGLVLISGTGSNAFLKNPDGSSHNSGGWGYVLGDEGSAWWISYLALKTVFDHMDNFVESPYPIDHVWSLIRKHFSVETRLDLLDHCYAKFNKPFFAGLCKSLAESAKKGDKLCQHLFNEAGSVLARWVHALIPKVQDSLVESGYLSIVCVGSVWLSWDLMRDSFIKQINTSPMPFGIRLVKITKPMAWGAVYLGADNIKSDLPRNYDDNFIVFHEYKQNCSVSGVGLFDQLLTKIWNFFS